MRVYLTVSGRMQQKYIYSSTVGYLTTNLRYLSLLAEVGSEEVKTLLLYFFRYRYSTGVCFFLTTFDFSLHLSTKICTFYSLHLLTSKLACHFSFNAFQGNYPLSIFCVITLCQFPNIIRLILNKNSVHITLRRHNKKETHREGHCVVVSVSCLQRRCSPLPGFSYFLDFFRCVWDVLPTQNVSI